MPLSAADLYCGDESANLILLAFAIYVNGHLQRPTEYWTMYLILRGYIPGAAFTQDRLPAKKVKSNNQDDGTVFVHVEGGRVHVNHRDYKYCPECQQYKKRDRYYWHRNSDGGDGYQSICRDCRNKQEAERIRIKRATA